MKNLLMLIVGLILTCNSHAYLWTSAVPTEVHIVGEGLVILGNFDNTGVTCATGAKAIFLPKEDLQYQAKLSIALTAKAMGKKIQVLIGDPISSNCIEISAHGFVPKAHYYYWQLKE